jgi:dihydroxy-acid dehydratase
MPLALDTRQRAMLLEMGVHVWLPGTGFGLHTAPEAAVGGPLAFVRDGDIITLDAIAGTLELEVSDEELARRRDEWVPPVSAHIRGWPMLYQRHVTQADLGCDLDFLRADTPEARVFVPPVVGRS